jgi:uncharacterized protein YoxC
VTGGEVALVALATAALLVLLFLLVAIRRLQATVEALRRDQQLLRDEVDATLAEARAEVARADAVLETAQSLSGTVDAASRLAYATLSNPVIKTMAYATGAGRAARRLGSPARR